MSASRKMLDQLPDATWIGFARPALCRTETTRYLATLVLFMQHDPPQYSAPVSQNTREAPLLECCFQNFCELHVL